MRKTKLSAIIMLIVVSMLGTMVPTWAQTIDSMDVINFDLEETLTSSDEYGPVVYGTNYGTSSDFGLGQLATKKYGRQKIDGVWNGFATLNFDNIDGGSFAAYAMEYKNNGTEDISDLEGTATVAFDIDAAETVSVENLYFALMTRDESGVNFAGVPVSENVESTGIALSEFTDEENFLCSTGTGESIDLSKFCGLGFVRMNVTGSETAPASAGRIFTEKLAIVQLKSIDDLSLEAVSDKVTVIFTAPTLEGLEYIINITGNDGSERRVTLSAEDFIVDGNNYKWEDTNVDQEVTYTYTITLRDTTYGLSSVSNSEHIRVPEDIGGTNIPATGESSKVIDTPVRNYVWTDGVEWLDYSLGAPKTTQVYNARALRPEMAAETILQVNLSYDNTYKNDAEATEFFGHMFDYYVVGYLAGGLSGGPSFTSKECTNIKAVEDTGSVVYRMYIDETMELSNAYFSIGQRWYGGNKDRINFAGVPMYDYVSDADKGKIITVSIPLTDFKMENPNRINRIWSYSWDGKASQEEAEADLQYFNFIGLMRDCNPANVRPESSGNIYISDMLVCSVNPISNLEVRDVTPSKIILGWDHTDTLVEKYNIYRDVAGEKVYIGSTALNRFVDTNDDNGFDIWATYDYYVEAVDEIGVASHMVKVSATVEPIAKPRNFAVQNYYSDTDTLAVDISWQPVSYGDVAKYVLYRNGAKYQEFGSDVTSYRDAEVTYAGTYTYHMVAVDTVGNASIDTEKFTVTAACVPVMENVQYTINNNDVTFGWNPNGFAQQYGLRVNGTEYLTTATSYTVEDLPYNTEINAYVWAINAAGAKSLEYEVRKFSIEKPGVTVAKTLFNDTIASGFKLESSGQVEMKTVYDKYVVGNSALMCNFNERLYNDQFVKIANNSWNIENLRDNNAALSFWIYVEDEVELDKLSVALEGNAVLYWANCPLRSSIGLESLVPARNKWVYVQIPLMSFADTGFAEYQGQIYEKPMEFTKLKGLSFVYNNSMSINGAKFYIDDIRLLEGTPWSVTAVTDDNGTAIGTEISANAKSIEVSFSGLMNVATLSSSNVWVEDNAGEVVDAMVTYDNGKCKIIFTEALANGTEYTLNIQGAKSEMGVLGNYTKTFTSNQDTITGDMAQLQPIAPVIIKTKSGSTEILTLTMPKTAAYNVANYTFTIAYDKDHINPNGPDAVTLASLEGATVTYGDELITITGNANKGIIEDELLTVVFSVKANETTTVSVRGSVEVVNMKTDSIQNLSVSSDITFAASQIGGAPGTGGSTDNDNGTAGREDGTVNGDQVISPSVGGGGGGGGGSSKPQEKPDDTTEEKPAETPEEPSKEETPATPSSFTDIGNIAWAKDSILTLIEKGVMSGYPDNTVKPEKTITREEFASLLVRAFSFKTESVESPFADVANDAWYAKAIIVAHEKGIVSGVDADNFGIGSTITREDMCTMIYRAMQASRMSVQDKYDQYVFADVEEISTYAAEAVNNLYRYGIVSGVSDTDFAPKTEVNRAMAARVLCGVMELM